MPWTRREVLAAGAGGVLGLAARADPTDAPRPPMGVVIHSYAIRRSADRYVERLNGRRPPQQARRPL